MAKQSLWHNVHDEHHKMNKASIVVNNIFAQNTISSYPQFPQENHFSPTQPEQLPQLPLLQAHQ